MWIAIAVLLVTSVLVGWIGRRATEGRLPRNHVAGLRTTATLADDEAWEVGNRVAGPSALLAGIGGGVATAGVAAIALAGASDDVVGLALVVAAGLIAALVVTGGIRGHLAARELLASREG